MTKRYKFKKGDFVTVSHFVKTKYEADVFDSEKIIHTPPAEWKTKKVLVATCANKDVPYLVVGVKQIKTGYYSPMVAPSSNWTGIDEGEPATFSPDKAHDVYVLEQANTQVWRTLEYALESDLTEATTTPR